MAGRAESDPLLAGKSGKEKIPFVLTRSLFVSIVFALIGPFLFGYNEGVLNTSHTVIVDALCGDSSGGCISDRAWSLIVYIYLLGGAPGAFFSGGLFRRFGFIRSSLIANFFMLLGSSFILGSTSFALFVSGRFLTGVASGMFTVLAPIYIADISHYTYRGRLGVLYQLFITLGIFVAVVTGLSTSVGTAVLWRIMFALPPALSLLQLVLARYAVESPVWLYLYKKKPAEGLWALEQLLHESLVEEKSLEIECAVPKARPCYSIEVLFEFNLRHALKEVIVLTIVQQLSGINSTFFFSSLLFSNIGVNNSTVVAIVICSVNSLMTLVPFFVIDHPGQLLPGTRFAFRLGRKGLLMCSFVGMTLGYAVITPALVYELGTLAVASNIFVIASFAVGLGPIPWIKVSEVSDYHWRSSVGSIAICINWMTNFAVAYSSWEILRLAQDYVFTPYLAITFVCCLVVPWCFLETTGLETHVITRLYERKAQNAEPQAVFVAPLSLPTNANAYTVQHPTANPPVAATVASPAPPVSSNQSQSPPVSIMPPSPYFRGVAARPAAVERAVRDWAPGTSGSSLLSNHSARNESSSLRDTTDTNSDHSS
eukprot:m.10466 g.10466  ORF g.10466 m.10466 type:complete len:597 (-) comp5608_c0_seq1:85-1875(-)